MTPFQQASFDPLSRARSRADIVALLEADKANVQRWLGRDLNTDEDLGAVVDAFLEEACGGLLFKNDTYQVLVRETNTGDGWPEMLHLSIRRLDREPIHDWRDLQEIKNQLVGEGHEALELYPAEDRRVDTSNQYHLWVVKDGALRFPFGFTNRAVDDTFTLGASKQRPLAPSSAKGSNHA